MNIRTGQHDLEILSITRVLVISTLLECFRLALTLGTLHRYKGPTYED